MPKEAVSDLPESINLMEKIHLTYGKSMYGGWYAQNMAKNIFFAKMIRFSKTS